MALDESKEEDDEIFTDREITYVVKKSLFDQVKPLNIDYIVTPRGSGFKIASGLEASGACGTGSCSC